MYENKITYKKVTQKTRLLLVPSFMIFFFFVCFVMFVKTVSTTYIVTIYVVETVLLILHDA